MARVHSHVHKLKRHKYKTTGHAVFFCVLDCAFKVDVGLALGKKTICWRCGGEAIINEYSIRLARPTCSSCKKTKNETELPPELTEAIVHSGTESLKERLNKSFQFQAKPDEDVEI